MPQYNIVNPGLLANGQIEDISQVLANFTAIKAIINALKDDNLDPAAAIAISKLAGYPADATKALKGDGSWGSAGAMSLICDQVLVAGQANFDTNTILGGNIPATYKHLKLFMQLRTNQAASLDAVNIRFNNDAGANYDYILLQAANAAVSGVDNIAGIGRVAIAPGATADANVAASIEAFFPNYAAAVFQKGVHAQAANPDFNVSGNIFLYNYYTQWHNVAAINRITILPNNGTQFVTGSRFSLYGLS